MSHISDYICVALRLIYFIFFSHFHLIWFLIWSDKPKFKNRLPNFFWDTKLVQKVCAIKNIDTISSPRIYFAKVKKKKQFPINCSIALQFSSQQMTMSVWYWTIYKKEKKPKLKYRAHTDKSKVTIHLVFRVESMNCKMKSEHLCNRTYRSLTFAYKSFKYRHIENYVGTGNLSRQKDMVIVYIYIYQAM